MTQKKKKKDTHNKQKPKDRLIWLKHAFEKGRKRWQLFMTRRPHRTFRLSKRRDYRRELVLPGYWSFTAEVSQLLWRHKRLFGSFVLTYGIVSALVIGVTSTGLFNEYRESATADFELFGISFDGMVRTLSLSLATMIGSFSTPLTETQQLMGGLMILVGWMTVVWLLRQVLAGRTVRLRDGIYTSSAPLVSTLIVMCVIVLQVLPVALGLIAYSVVASGGIATGGVEAMLAWSVIVLLAVLSLFWITSSLLALVIVTLPGTYPFAALKQAGDMVTGYRTRLLLRFVWAAVITIISWLLALVPIIILHESINIDWLPLLPIAVSLLTAITLLWFSSYVYLLYRKVVDESARTL